MKISLDDFDKLKEIYLMKPPKLTKAQPRPRHCEETLKYYRFAIRWEGARVRYTNRNYRLSHTNPHEDTVCTGTVVSPHAITKRGGMMSPSGLLLVQRDGVIGNPVEDLVGPSFCEIITPVTPKP